MKTVEQLKFVFAPKDVSYNLTKSHHVSAASANYSRSSRWKPEGGGGQKAPLVEDRVKALTTIKEIWHKCCSG